MDPLEELVGRSAGVEAVRATIRRLLQHGSGAGQFPPILIQGETGTGKGLAARLIHRVGPRAGEPFVEVNCAAIPPTLMESELFGFERGAFTDARRAKPGLFQSAHRGTIFLDEISLLAEPLQAKLLTVIEERRVRALGRTRSEHVDVWILAATNDDLAAAAGRGRFRQDLYHRLAVLPLRIPPLRERRDDIPVLAAHFLEWARVEYDLPPKRLTPGARAALVAYRWPGNVRELKNVMERVFLLSEASDVTEETLGLRESSEGESAPALHPPIEEVVTDLERARILEALEQTGGNISRASAVLGLTRNKLRYRIDKYDLAPKRSRPRRPGRPAVDAPPGAAVPAACSPVRWERRRLALLRAEVVGTSSLSPAVSTAIAVRVLAEKLQSFGARIEETLPAGLFAVFGLEPVEDAARRAAHAAMAMQKAAGRLEPARGDRVEARVAIHVAEVRVGLTDGGIQIDPESRSDSVRALDGVLAAARPGHIVVSRPAARLLERRFGLVATDEAADGGATAAFRLVGHERSGLGVAGERTRFVGRRGELELAKSRVAAVMRGHGQTVGIVGEAGIGKSRLLHELRQLLRTENVTVLRGRCLPYGRAVPYFLILDILRQTLRITEGDDPGRIGERVAAALRELALDASLCAPYLLLLLGVTEGTEGLAGLSDEAIKTGTLDVVRHMLLSGSRRRPIIYMAEDLHWIDKASEDALVFLVEHLAGAPILFLGTYRPGYRPPWTDRSSATQIALQPLSPDESLELVRSVLQARDLPESLTRAIVDKAEGNPFFLEEMARVGRDETHGAPPVIPDTIQEVLLARINRLPREARRFLQTVCVLGRDVSPTLIRSLWKEPAEDHLAELVRLEFLQEHGHGGERAYVFTHTLTQEVAYETLPADERRRLHAAAADAVKAMYADRLTEAYERLAYHYSRAEDDVNAVEYLTRSAERAVRSFAHEEAVRALQAALVHAGRLPAGAEPERTTDLVLRQAASLIPLGRFQEALDLLLQHQERLDRLDRPFLAGHYYFLVSRAYSFLGSYERASQAAQRAIVEATRCGDDATTGKAYSVLAMEAPMVGRAVQGIQDGRRAIALLEATDERWWLGHSHWVVGINHCQMGDFETALAAEGRAYAIGEAMGDARLQAYASWVTGIIYAAIGESEAGIEACRRAHDRSPDPLNRAIARGFLGYAHLEAGDTARAVPLLQGAVQRLGEFHYRPLQGWFAAFLAEALRLRGDLEHAADVARQGLVISRDGGFRIGLGWAEQVLGRIASQRRVFAEAAEHLEAARGIFSDIQSRYELGRTFLDLAALAQSQGDREGASRNLGAALRLFVELRVPKYVERISRLAQESGVPLAGAPNQRALS